MALSIVAWLLCVALIGVVAARHLHRPLNIDSGPVLAVAFDVLPVVLLIAWPVAVVAWLTGRWVLAGVATALCIYHVVVLVPRVVASRRSRWTRHAPRFDVVVANVFVDNETPEAAARQLIAAEVDLMLIVESTKTFMAIFDRLGGKEAFPGRVADPDDDSDYAVTLASRVPLGENSRMCIIGPLRLAIADIDVGGVRVLVAGLNPMATVDPGGHETWKEQIDALAEFVETVSLPLLVVGDLNSTRFRPEFGRLLDLGLTDAIDSLGKGLKPSFKLSANGPLAAIGPVVRLDHALVNSGMQALALENLEPCGSDHLPFRLRLAVRNLSAAAT